MRKWTLAALALTFFSVALSAQTVDEIIAKNIQAHGGMAKLKSIQSIRMTGDFDAGGMQAGFTQVFKRPMKIRIEASIQGLTMIQAYDGQSGWQVIPFTGKKDAEPMAADDLKNFQEQADFDGPLVDYKQKGHKVELVGKEKVEGTNVYHLKVTLKNGDIVYDYLDPDTFIEIRREIQQFIRGSVRDRVVGLGSYKPVAGVMFPFSISQGPKNHPDEQTTTVQKMEVNVPIDPADFALPASLKTEEKKSGMVGVH